MACPPTFMRVLIFMGYFGNLYIHISKPEKYLVFKKLIGVDSKIITNPFATQLMSNRLFSAKYTKTEASFEFLRTSYRRIMKDFFTRSIGKVVCNISDADRLNWFYNYVLFSCSDYSDGRFQLRLHIDDGVSKTMDYSTLFDIICACCLNLRCLKENDALYKESRQKIANFGNFNMITFENSKDFDEMIRIFYNMFDKHKDTGFGKEIIHPSSNVYYEVNYFRDSEIRINDMFYCIKIQEYSIDRNPECGIYLNLKHKVICFPCSRVACYDLEKRLKVN